MGLKINGSTSGSIEIDVPAVAGTDTAITIPATTGGEFIVSDASGNVDLGALDISGSAAADSVKIDASGRLLVGTSSGSQPLSVVNSQSSKIQFGQASDQGGFLFSDAAGGFGISGGGYYNGTNWIAKATSSSHIRDDGNGVLKFFTNASLTAGSTFTPTERMKLSSAGRLDVFAGSATDTTILSSAASAGGSIELISGRHSASGTGVGTKSFLVFTNGNVQNTNNSYGSTSDIKLKENIVDASSQWDDLKAIQVRKYNFKEETGHQTHTQLGVVAQEVELVSPGLVSESPDRDEDGNDLGTTTKSVNYSVLYMKAVKALQEAMERIETLETANASLEARLTALEGGAA